MDINEVLFYNILNSLNCGVEITDRDYNVVFVNDYEKKITYGDADVSGKKFTDFFTWEEMEESGMPQAMENGTVTKDKVTHYINCSGRRCVAIINTFPIENNGEIIGAVSIGEDITSVYHLSRQNVEMKENKSQVDYCIDDIAGSSNAISNVKEMIMLAATNDANVLITGETGTGKELVAQSIYSLSKDRLKGQFVAFNCAAVPEALLESLLFGTVKGSFTGAEDNKGLFEHAQDGVLFLDEVNLMPQELQSKLLRVIQERKVRRVGSNEEIPLNFKLITSSNRSIIELQKDESFRKDLFYRINVISINIPALRERTSDIPKIVEKLLSNLKLSSGTNVTGIHKDVVDWMQEQHWYGNVRELKNFIERIVYLSKSTIITMDNIETSDLQSFSATIEAPDSKAISEESNVENKSYRLKEIISQTEKEIIISRLKANNGNAARTARELDIPKQTLHNKIIKYDIDAGDYKVVD